MEAYINFENQIAMMDSIIQSVSEMIGAFKGKEIEDNRAKSTIKQIFFFLDRVVEVFPRVLLADDHDTVIKDQLVKSIVNVKKEWTRAQVLNDSFEAYWNELSSWWGEYRKQLIKIQDKKQGLYLSSN